MSLASLHWPSEEAGTLRGAVTRRRLPAWQEERWSCTPSSARSNVLQLIVEFPLECGVRWSWAGCAVFQQLYLAPQN